MIFIEPIAVAIRALLTNKLRSLLTMLGIMIGIAAVLAMVAIGDGAKEIILEDLEKISGINVFTVLQVSSKRVAGRRVRIRSGEYLNYGDVLAIERECPSVQIVAPRVPEWSRVLMQAPDGTNIRAGYNGVDEDYAIALAWDLATGRFISEEDVKNSTKVAVLGANVATELFGEVSPLGKEIKIARRTTNATKERLTVIGTLVPRGRSLEFGFSFDDLVFMPITTVQQRFTGNNRIPQIAVQVPTVEDMPRAIEEVKAVIRKRHRGQDDFFAIFDVRLGLARLMKISTIIKTALGGIAGFSLLVGGIGIMNMMLVAVGERTREIGLRNACGAKRADILLQFLSESILLCSIGGIFGIGLGVFASKGMAYIAVRIVKIVPEWPAVLSPQWALISIFFSMLLGVSFGLYPAIKATRMSPIEALRIE